MSVVPCADRRGGGGLGRGGGLSVGPLADGRSDDGLDRRDEGGACVRVRSQRRGRAGREHREEGSAVVEFVVLAVLLLVPVVYLVVTLGRLQAAAFATDGGARAAARAFVTADDESSGSARARAAARLALLDQGFDAFDAGDARLTLDCTPRPCLTPGGRVGVVVSADVLLPLVPSALDAVVPARVTVRSRQVAAVDAFRAAP